MGCTIKGVCGKSDTLSSYMDGIKSRLRTLSKIANVKEAEGMNVDFVDEFIMDSLFMLITNANFKEDVLKNRLEVESLLIEEKLTGKKPKVNFTEEIKKGNQKNTEDEDLRSVQETILYGLMGISAYNHHSKALGADSLETRQFIRLALEKLEDSSLGLMELVMLLNETGKHGVLAMKLLDGANTGKFGNPEISEVQLGVKNNPGILITGHDLNDIEQLLEQSKNSGVDIYTHSEMLPAHYYPKLKKYTNLVGNYGGAWHDQKETFETFNGL